jgi:type II secretory pathway component PulK
MVDKITTSASGGMVFEGSGIEVFRLLAIAQALELYAKTGIKANTAYTPSNMLRAATESTGKTYQARAVLPGRSRSPQGRRRSAFEDRVRR